MSNGFGIPENLYNVKASAIKSGNEFYVQDLSMAFGKKWKAVRNAYVENSITCIEAIDGLGYTKLLKFNENFSSPIYVEKMNSDWQPMK